MSTSKERSALMLKVFKSYMSAFFPSNVQLVSLSCFGEIKYQKDLPNIQPVDLVFPGSAVQMGHTSCPLMKSERRERAWLTAAYAGF